MAVDTRRRLEDLPRSRLETAPWCSVVPGFHPGLFSLSDWCGLAQDQILSRLGLDDSEMVETRRLELLTLSLQRRCSAN
jgi:hypothetical protein